MADEINKLDEELDEVDEESNEPQEKDEEITKKGEGLVGVQEGIQGGLEPAELKEQIQNSFLDYAMSTITARALPDARDGMKPVQRRIIYGMANMGVWPDKPYKKSARIVGDVMGRYHPHGDSSIYLAMARMAQDFAMRELLVYGHGNFGSQDGDEPAASRYTEAKLSKLSLQMVRDINKDTVDFVDTYDADGKEPTVLPSRIPNLIINGSQGIAVGMATNIPPHNLKESFDAIIALIKNPELTNLDLMSYIKGPDFPGGGLICGRAGIRKYFETGIGSVRVRGKYEIKDDGKGKSAIVFTEVPYMTNKKELAKQIMDLADKKILEGIQDIADYSDDKRGTMFQIDLKKNASPEIVVSHLFKYTKLQSNFAVNMLALDHGAPKILNMKQYLNLYIDFQREIIRRRTIFDLKKAQDRLHVLEGLLIAVDNIDECVKIIRNSKTQEEASLKLKERFEFDDVQIKAILDLSLRKLVGLERDKLIDEKASLLKDVDEYNHILNDASHLDEVLIKEMEEIKNTNGDERRTEISDAISDDSDEDLIEDSTILITLTKGGYIKRLSPNEFRLQHKGGVGVSGMTTKEDDEVILQTVSRTKTDVMLFTNLGRVYKIRGYKIPEGSRTSKGLPIVNFLSLKEDEKVLSILSVDEYNDNEFLFFATKNGIVKKTMISEFVNINKAGKIAIGLKEGDTLIGVKKTDGNCKIAIGSKAGKVCLFDEKDVHPTGRTASGVKGINLSGSEVVSFSTSLEGNLVLTVSSNGFAKMSSLDIYRETNRGSKGVISMKVGEKTGTMTSMNIVNGDEDIIVSTDAGTVMKTSLTQINVIGRNSKGVILIRLKDKENISSISIIASEQTIEEQTQIEQKKAEESNKQLEESQNDIDLASSNDEDED